MLITVAPINLVPAQRHTQAPTQTSFGYDEDVAVKKPVSLPKGVLEQLVKENRARLQNCLTSDKETQDNLREYFAASSLDVNNDGQLDLIVTGGKYCLQGAHSTPFWIFVHTDQVPATGYRRVFSGVSQFLTILRTRTKGHSNILTEYPTAVKLYAAVWKFNGAKYVPRNCYEQKIGSRRRVQMLCGEIAATSE